MRDPCSSVPAPARRIAATLALLSCQACALIPGELNLAPVYRHRLDEAGNVLEMDFLWPVFHYERTADGGTDFRIRPLYRRVREGAPPGAVEHQFLWPLGRVNSVEDDVNARLFPLWRYASRINEKGERDVDWYALLLLWGGWTDSGDEDYFAFLPFYADIPGFLTYDQFRVHLFPLHVYTEKNGKKGHQFLWPLFGFGGNDSGSIYWRRLLPLFSVSVDEERFARYSLLWPLFGWGSENIDLEGAHDYFLFWPLFGFRTGPKVSGWTFLWPLFQENEIEDRFYKLDLLWPFYRRQFDNSPSRTFDQWWFWPFVGHAVSPNRNAWSFLWPLIWWREFYDPDGTQRQRFFVPFYWSVHRDRADGGADDFIRIWPFVHARTDHDGTGDWSVPSPLLWRESNIYGVEEAYGWLWTLARGQRRAPDDRAFDLAAHAFTTRTRKQRTQTSVPFLFNYESDDSGSVLRLLQFIPIPLGGGNGEPRGPR